MRLGGVLDRSLRPRDVHTSSANAAQTVTAALVTEPDRFDRVIEVLLFALLAFMPLAFGAVHAWSEMVVVGAAAAISICFALKMLFRRDVGYVWTWAYLPVILYLLLVAFQLLPLPAAVVKFLSPNTFATKTELLGDLPGAAEQLRLMTLTFYANATKHDLRLLLAITAVFVVVLNVYRSPDQIKRLLAVIAIAGGAVGVLALAQVVSGAEKIFWLVETRNDPTAGSFANYSNYSQFMNLSIGAALALMLIMLYEKFISTRISLPAVVERLVSPSSRVLWLLMAMMVLGATSIVLSFSRAGAVSLLVAASFTTIALATRRALSGSGWVLVGVTLAAFVCILYIGFDAVYERLATLAQFTDEYAHRWQILRDVVAAWSTFPLIGSGQGTHEFVFPMFYQDAVSSLAAHAENEYGQAAEETGILGLLLMVAFLVIVWINYVRLVRDTSSPARAAVFGLGFGLVAIMVHSFSDFGQHVPANACLTAIACGLLIGLCRGEAKTMYRSPLVRGLPLVLLVIIWSWALLGANRARAAEADWEQALRLEAYMEEQEWEASNEDYAMLLGHALQATAHEPDNVKYRHWLNVYRWRSISRVKDPETGDTVLAHGAEEFTRRIIEQFQEAISHCPTFGPSYCMIGQLELFVMNNPAGADLVLKGYKLAPNIAMNCLMAGTLDATEGRIDDAMIKFRHGLELSGSLFGDIAEVIVNEVNRPDLAAELAGDSTNRMAMIIAMLEGRQEHVSLVARLEERTIERLKVHDSPDASVDVLIQLATQSRRRGEWDVACDYYRRALAREYGRVDWRLAYAETLGELGDTQKAINEARICLRLRPQFEPAKKLIEQLSIRGD